MDNIVLCAELQEACGLCGCLLWGVLVLELGQLAFAWFRLPDLGGEFGLPGAAARVDIVGEVRLPAEGGHVALYVTSPTDYVEGLTAGIPCPMRGEPAVGAGGGANSRPYLLSWALPVKVAVASN